MSLQTRLAALVTAIGADIKALKTFVAAPTLLNAVKLRWNRTDGSEGSTLQGSSNIVAGKKHTYLEIVSNGEGGGEGRLDLLARAGDTGLAQFSVTSDPIHPTMKRRADVVIQMEDGSFKNLLLLGSNGISDFVLGTHTHDDRYYTEGESDNRFLQGDDSRLKMTGLQSIQWVNPGANSYYEPLFNLPGSNLAGWMPVGMWNPRDYSEFMRVGFAGENASQGRFRFFNDSNFNVPLSMYFTYVIIYYG